MNILFPMGGRGSRLGYYSSNPKPLIKILGKTILEWSVQSLNLDGNYIFCINKKHDEEFKNYLKRVRAMGIDMETATIFITGFANGIDRGALLLGSDTPMVPEGVKTEESDKEVTRKYVKLHIEIGIEAMTSIGGEGEKIKHFTY